MNELNGVLVVDKPENATSARVVNLIKRTVGAKKAGHTGTLDPFATGVMVCCLNKATRLANFFLKADKTYEAVLFLGVSTDTQDKTGAVVSTAPYGALSPDEIIGAFGRFKGAITQKPPVYSALKYKGEPLYKLARRGMPVQKPPRRIQVHHLDILDIRLPEVRFSVRCSAGTYVRTLCHDIGDALGCGGHLKALRRIESGGFTIHEAHTLADIEDMAARGRIGDAMIGMADALRGMPACMADQDLAERIKNGVRIQKSDLGTAQPGEAEPLLKIVDPQNRLLAVVKNDEALDHYVYACVVAG